MVILVGGGGDTHHCFAQSNLFELRGGGEQKTEICPWDLSQARGTKSNNEPPSWNLHDLIFYVGLEAKHEIDVAFNEYSDFPFVRLKKDRQRSKKKITCTKNSHQYKRAFILDPAYNEFGHNE